MNEGLEGGRSSHFAYPNVQREDSRCSESILTNGGRRGLVHIEQPVDSKLPNSVSVGDACSRVKAPCWTTYNNNLHPADGTTRHPSCCFRQY